ncbi:PTS lactose/cellobiose transporter subunit IIA [Facklamia lactis]|uniref:PTS lactose/cellobiose transporter subunit IIA n=1 Tax=Facklamia lactis TaxID=2749967 RepID=UPI002E2BAEF9|nr:PTS lactose/cellobiose transporter subunit IIA [Facklamia lactis]
MEEIIFEIIANGGNAKSLAYEAIMESENGHFEKAEALLKEADESLKLAHNTQTQLITDEVNGKHIQVSVLFVHAQDHLMSAIEVRSLAERFIHLNQRLAKLENREEN